MFDPEQHQPSRTRTRTPRAWARMIGQTILTAGAAVGVWWLTRTVLAMESPARSAAALNFVLPIVMMAMVVGGLLWQEFRWYRPRRRLLQLMAEISAAQMPIDALREVGGGIAPIASASAGAFHQNRLLQQRLARQDMEMSQRVQSRTDAMERVIGSLRHQAIRDGLTGLLNRRALDDLLPRLIDHCRAKEEDLALMMIDVDFFKQLNDQLGHPAGDELLKNLGQIIRSSLQRPVDVGFRCGGDEFVIVLPGCPLAPANKLADRLARLVDQLCKTIKSTPRPGISIGVACINELTNPGATELMHEADRRLYDTKQAHHAQRQVA